MLLDVERIAPCMPGAQLQEIEGDEYRGVVKVKVGPITAQYKGAARIIEADEAARRIVLKGEGRDTRGQGNASATVTVLLAPDGDGTQVSVDTDLNVTGQGGAVRPGRDGRRVEQAARPVRGLPRDRTCSSGDRIGVRRRTRRRRPTPERRRRTDAEPRAAAAGSRRRRDRRWRPRHRQPRRRAGGSHGRGRRCGGEATGAGARRRHPRSPSSSGCSAAGSPDPRSPRPNGQATPVTPVLILVTIVVLSAAFALVAWRRRVTSHWQPDAARSATAPAEPWCATVWVQRELPRRTMRLLA